MVQRQQDRSLEVIVMAGRGLSDQVPKGSRRKVQLTLVSPKDIDGEAFGAKVSPWTEVQGDGLGLRFGSSGLKCSFPMSGKRGAPSLANDPLFVEHAHLRVRLLSSSVSSRNSMIQTAAALLPTSVMDFASQEVDEATAQLEAEVSVPLTNILSGRVGHAADRALGGWVPLRCCLDDDDDDDAAQIKDQLPPALWMQMYVLPDHEAMVPKLQAQLLQEASRLPKPAMATVQPKAKPPPASNDAARLPAKSKAGGYAQAPPPPKWGPASTAKTTTQTQVLEDLIDVSLDDSNEPAPLLHDLNTLNLLEFDANVTDLPSVQQELPRVAGTSGTGNLPVASGFSFIHQAPAQPVPAPSPQQTSTGSSAFGFIASGGGGSKLDLAALYASSEAAKASPFQASCPKYSALASVSDFTTKLAPKATAPMGKTANPGSLESLEQSILADLTF